MKADMHARRQNTSLHMWPMREVIDCCTQYHMGKGDTGCSGELAPGLPSNPALPVTKDAPTRGDIQENQYIIKSCAKI